MNHKHVEWELNRLNVSMVNGDETGWMRSDYVFQNIFNKNFL